MRVPISVTVNNEEHHADVEPRLLLVDYLRQGLALTGAHVGCETSQCGACTVLFDGAAVKACTILAVQADGAKITTIEGLAPAGTLHPIQQAFWDEHGVQCGFCTPGMIITVAALLNTEPRPTEAQIRHGLEGNICRCTGYHNIVRAVQTAAAALEAGTRPRAIASHDTGGVR